MSDNESVGDKVVGGAKTVLGCGLQAILIWIGVVILFSVIVGVGLWIFDFFG